MGKNVYYVVDGTVIMKCNNLKKNTYLIDSLKCENEKKFCICFVFSVTQLDVLPGKVLKYFSVSN